LEQLGTELEQGLGISQTLLMPCLFPRSRAHTYGTGMFRVGEKKPGEPFDSPG